MRSAKLKGCADDGDGACTSDEEIHLLFESGGQRGRTFVLGLACTAGVADGVRTALYLDPIALDCDVNSDAATFLADVTINPAPTASPGNLCEAGALSTTPPSTTSSVSATSSAVATVRSVHAEIAGFTPSATFQ